MESNLRSWMTPRPVLAEATMAPSYCSAWWSALPALALLLLPADDDDSQWLVLKGLAANAHPGFGLFRLLGSDCETKHTAPAHDDCRASGCWSRTDRREGGSAPLQHSLALLGHRLYRGESTTARTETQLLDGRRCLPGDDQNVDPRAESPSFISD